MHKNKKTSTYYFNPRLFWMDEDKLKQAYKSGKVSHCELIVELFDRIKKEEHYKGEDTFKNEELRHFTLDEDFGDSWRELIVREKYPHFFFKNQTTSTPANLNPFQNSSTKGF